MEVTCFRDEICTRTERPTSQLCVKFRYVYKHFILRGKYEIFLLGHLNICSYHRAGCLFC